MSTPASIITYATDLQRRAADPATSVWVAASAGSGKTKVLTDRFVRLLLSGVPPQKILCLTYTRAAAAEMHLRLMRILGGWSIAPEEMLRDDLGRLLGAEPTEKDLRLARALFARCLDCPGGLRLRTLHAFAQEVLARFPIEAGIAPQTEILDDTTARALQEQVRDDILSTNAPFIATLLRAYSDIDTLIGSVLFDRARFASLFQKHKDAAAVTQALRDKNGIERSMTHAQILQTLLAETDDKAITRAADALSSYGSTWQKNLEKIAAWQSLSIDDRGLRIERYFSVFLTQSKETRQLRVKKNLVPKDALEERPDLSAIVMAEAERLQAGADALCRAEEVETTAALCAFAEDFLSRYALRKARRAALDYDDLIDKTVALLERPGLAPWVLFKLDGGIDHVMVDEAQDTSPQQWRILEALTQDFFDGESARTHNRTLFVVGDAKQSIYSFQHADPRNFYRMRDVFAARCAASEKPFARVPMEVSFRSAPAILHAVDEIFRPDDVRSGVSDTPIGHIAHRAQACGSVTLWPVLVPDGKKVEDSEQALTPEESLRHPSLVLAERIATHIETLIKDGHHNAPVTPGDILVLVQSRNAFVPALVRALREKTIPVAGVDRMQLGAQLCVCDLLALAQCALLPEDDLTLAAVLKGPLIGMDDATLERLCAGRSGRLWDELRAERNDRRIKEAADYLSAALARADQDSIADFFHDTLNGPCPADPAGSGRRAFLTRLGPDASDPLDECLTRAQAFAQGVSRSWLHFLRAMTDDDGEIKREMEQAGGAVRIMTVHAAKGLQAKFVILPDTARTPGERKTPPLLWAADGLPVARGPNQSMGTRALIDAFQSEQEEENKRLLYVALTRAEDHLAIYGYRGAQRSKPTCWHRLITRALAPNNPSTPHAPLALHHDARTQENATPPAPASVGAVPPLPSWARRPARTEHTCPVRAPSQLDADQDDESIAPPPSHARNRFARGNALHRLLQFLPDLPMAVQEDAAGRFLRRQGFSEDDRASISKETLDLLRHPTLGALFGPSSQAEVSIAGQVGQQPLAGQIDRLLVREKEVLILDYKTNRPPPTQVADIPRAYRRQMAAYAALARSIWPDKSVRCFLLWTYNATLMEVPDEEGLLLDLERPDA